MLAAGGSAFVDAASLFMADHAVGLVADMVPIEHAYRQ
jgi:hypothetical protein